MEEYRERAAHDWTDDSVRLIATPSLFAKSALFYVQEAGYFQTFNDYFTEREKLDSYLIVYTVSGAGRLVYNRKAYPLGPGHIFFIDCMNYQLYHVVQGKRWEILWVHLNGLSVRAYYDQFASNGGPVHAITSQSAIPAHLQELVALNRRKSLRTELLSSKILVHILTELLLSTASKFDQWDKGMPEMIIKALQYMEKHYREKLSLERLAQHCSVSKYHLAKEFKKHVSFSPGEYLIMTRMTRAKQLLQSSGLTVSEIAYQVGIDNVSHFINLFKQREGTTPLTYRKRWTNPAKTDT